MLGRSLGTTSKTVHLLREPGELRYTTVMLTFSPLTGWPRPRIFHELAMQSKHRQFMQTIAGITARSPVTLRRHAARDRAILGHHANPRRGTDESVRDR